MLDIRRVLASAPKKHTEETLNSLTTVWGEALDTSNVLPEHPRPRMQRDNYVMLNGVWEYAIAPVDGEVDAETLALQEIPSRWDGQIVVPFSPEAPLSGVGRTVRPYELLWYRRKIDLPELVDDQRLILHFDAVDWMCACFVNGKLAGTHTGGYLPFSFDVTDLLGSAAAGESATTGKAGVATAAEVADAAELVLCVWDPSDTGSQLRGKQRLSRGDIWYTAQSGIWQSVWYEVVSAAHLESLTLKGDMFGALEVRANVQVSGLSDVQTGAFKLELTLKDELGQDVLLARLPVSEAGEICEELQVDKPQLWSPERPYLYFVEATLWRDGVAVDFVRSYCAFRTVEVKPDEAGVPRVHLNGAPYFVRGVLDQGYWPDGLLTAPSDDALVYDIEAMKSAGFNTLRKQSRLKASVGITTAIVLACWFGRIVFREVAHIVPGTRVRSRRCSALPGDDLTTQHQVITRLYPQVTKAIARSGQKLVRKWSSSWKGILRLDFGRSLTRVGDSLMLAQLLRLFAPWMQHVQSMQQVAGMIRAVAIF